MKDAELKLKSLNETLKIYARAVDLGSATDELNDLIQSVLLAYLKSGSDVASGNDSRGGSNSEALRHIVHNSSEYPFVLVEVKSGKILEWNKCMENLTAFPAQMAVNNHFEIFMDPKEERGIQGLCADWKKQIAACDAPGHSSVSSAQVAMKLLGLGKGAPVFEIMSWDAKFIPVVDGKVHTHTLITSSTLPQPAPKSVLQELWKKSKSSFQEYEGHFKVDADYKPTHMGLERDFEILAEHGSDSEHTDTVLGYVWSLALSVNKLLRNSMANLSKAIMQRSTTSFEFGNRESDNVPICTITRSFSLPEFGKTVRSNILYQQPMNLEMCPIIEYLPLGFMSILAPVYIPDKSASNLSFIMLAFSKGTQVEKAVWEKHRHARCEAAAGWDETAANFSPWNMPFRSKVRLHFYPTKKKEKGCLREMAWGRSAMDADPVKSDQGMISCEAPKD